MLFLFNKVYLAPDAMINPAANVMFMTPKAVAAASNDLMVSLNQLDFGAVHLASSSYDEAIVEMGSEQALFDFIASFNPTQRLTIYLEPASFMKLAFKWYKTILTNIDETMFVRLWLSICNRYRYLYGYHPSPVGVWNADQAATFKYFGGTMADRAVAIDLWRSTEPFDISSYDRAMFERTAAVELQIATYFADPEWQHADALESKILGFVDTIMVRSLVEAKREVLNQLHTLPNFNPREERLEQWVERHPQYEILTDSAATFNNVEYVIAKYGRENFRALYSDLYLMVGGAQEHIDVVYPTVDFMSPSMTLDRLLEIELNHTRRPYYLAAGSYAGLINIYLLQIVIALKRANNTEELRKLSVAA